MLRKMSFKRYHFHYIDEAVRPRAESSLRREIRRAQRRRLLTVRPLLLCIISAFTLLVVLYLQATTQPLSDNSAAFWQHQDDPGAGWLRQKNLLLTASRSRRHSGQSPAPSSNAQFAVPPLHQFTTTRRNNDDSSEDSERYHNPSLYGWTPDVYPDPLLNPIRCAIAYLPETNMTDGLRYVFCEESCL